MGAVRPIELALREGGGTASADGGWEVAERGENLRCRLEEQAALQSGLGPRAVLAAKRGGGGDQASDHRRGLCLSADAENLAQLHPPLAHQDLGQRADADEADPLEFGRGELVLRSDLGGERRPPLQRPRRPQMVGGGGDSRGDRLGRDRHSKELPVSETLFGRRSRQRAAGENGERERERSRTPSPPVSVHRPAPGLHMGPHRPIASLRALRAIALAAAVAACAAPPLAIEDPPILYPSSARERLVRIALAEWEEWGRQFTDHTGTVAGAPAQVPRLEDEEQAFPALVAYWSTVPGREETVARNRARLRRLQAGGLPEAALWADVPWSAAFLSFLLRSAGYDAIDAPSAEAHWVLVDHLLARHARFPTLAAFVPHPPLGRAPRPGDLLCATRNTARGRYASPDDRAAEFGRPVPMHCDVVVAVREGVIEAVGGNLGDAVRLVLLPARADGRLGPAPAQAPPLPAWFVLFENRSGRSPPLARHDTLR